MDRKKFGDLISRSMEPDIWREYDRNKGRICNDDSLTLIDTIRYADKVMAMINREGYEIVKKET